MFSNLRYSIKQAFSQMGRNTGMYVTSVVSITAMMLILGLFFAAFVNVEIFTESIRDDYNVVQVYMSADNKDEANKAAGKQIEAMSGVEKAEFVSSDEALKTLKERWGDNGYLLDNLQSNPLPNSYMVYVSDEDAAKRVAENVVNIKGVDDITYYQDTIDKLARISRFIEIGSIVAMAFLIIVAIVMVANTIKLTVFNREKEIGIMKYLGATDWFVRAPFVFGGIFVGLISSVLATGFIYLIYDRILALFGTDVVRMLSITLVSTNYLVFNLFIIFISLGVGIGTVGSFISIRRFLDK